MKTRKNTIKLIFDICMVILMVILYKKQVISMTFHEIGGLTFLGLVLIHIILNRKWVMGVIGKSFAKKTPVKARIMALTDLLLLVDFILMGISSVMISRIVFHINMQGMIFKTMHYFCAALALILIGIHLGLHQKMFANLFFHKPVFQSKTAGVIKTAVWTAITAFGAYAICTTDFLRWLSMPFPSMASAGAGMQDAGQMMQKAGQAAGMMPHGAAQSFSLAGLLLVLVQFFSIVFAFAAITALTERLLSRNHASDRA